MKNITDDTLFTSLTPEEEEAIQGGWVGAAAKFVGSAALIALIQNRTNWVINGIEGIWLNTNGRAGAERTQGVYSRGKSPVDQNQVWEVQFYGETRTGYGRTAIGILRGINVS